MINRLHRIDQIQVENKSVLVRLDLNVPLRDGVIQDETRIDACLPTLKYLQERAKYFAVCSHLGRPKSDRDKKYSLEPVYHRLADLLEMEAVFVDDYVQEDLGPVVKHLEKNQFVGFENLRFFPGEKKNDPAFARRLASGFDVYINDAFGVCHRADASVHAVTDFFKPDDRAVGFLVSKELERLDELKNASVNPYVVVLGGAKVSDKLGVISNLIERCNTILVGGAMAYTFLKAQGLPVGKSLVEDSQLAFVEDCLKRAEKKKVQIVLPVDHLVARSPEDDPVTQASIPEDSMGLDIGPQTIQLFQKHIGNAKILFWNGPMGMFEKPRFAEGTLQIGKAVAALYKERQVKTFVGGGDSVSAIKKMGLDGDIYHLSTGGGASLEYLEGKVLPALDALLEERG